ncbi:MAG: hypothetical protein ACTS6J_25425 [Burkholderiales bacterium]
MTFAFDASVTPCWLFLDGEHAERTCALRLLDAMKRPGECVLRANDC